MHIFHKLMRAWISFFYGFLFLHNIVRVKASILDQKWRQLFDITAKLDFPKLVVSEIL